LDELQGQESGSTLEHELGVDVESNEADLGGSVFVFEAVEMPDSLRDSVSCLSCDEAYFRTGTYTIFQRGELEVETGDTETECGTTRIGLTLDITESRVDMVPGTSNDATVEVPGRPKHRKALRQQDTDALNGCLCGEVLQRLSNGVLKCRQAGCETQWVFILLNHN